MIDFIPKVGVTFLTETTTAGCETQTCLFPNVENFFVGYQYTAAFQY